MSLGVRQGMEFCTVYRIIFTNIDVIDLLRKGKVAAVRNIRKVLILAGSGDENISILFRLFSSLLCPLTGDNIGCFFLFHQIHRNGSELMGCAAALKKNAVRIRNSHESAQILFRLINHVLKGL